MKDLASAKFLLDRSLRKEEAQQNPSSESPVTPSQDMKSSNVAQESPRRPADMVSDDSKSGIDNSRDLSAVLRRTFQQRTWKVVQTETRRTQAIAHCLTPRIKPSDIADTAVKGVRVACSMYYHDKELPCASFNVAGSYEEMPETPEIVFVS